MDHSGNIHSPAQSRAMHFTRRHAQVFWVRWRGNIRQLRNLLKPWWSSMSTESRRPTISHQNYLDSSPLTGSSDAVSTAQALATQTSDSYLGPLRPYWTLYGRYRAMGHRGDFSGSLQAIAKRLQRSRNRGANLYRKLTSIAKRVSEQEG